MEDSSKETGEGEYRWCLVGNIVDHHRYGEYGEIRRGTKHFRPGAKVYLFPEYGGVAHEQIVAVGRPRKRRSMIRVVIPAKLIKNVRLKKVYSPKILEKIGESVSYRYSKINPDEDLVFLNGLVKLLNGYTDEINIDSENQNKGLIND